MCPRSKLQASVISGLLTGDTPGGARRPAERDPEGRRRDYFFWPPTSFCTASIVFFVWSVKSGFVYE